MSKKEEPACNYKNVWRTQVSEISHNLIVTRNLHLRTSFMNSEILCSIHSYSYVALNWMALLYCHMRKIVRSDPSEYVELTGVLCIHRIWKEEKFHKSCSQGPAYCTVCSLNCFTFQTVQCWTLNIIFLKHTAIAAC